MIYAICTFFLGAVGMHLDIGNFHDTVFLEIDTGCFQIKEYDLMEEFIRAGVDFDISKCRLVDVQTIFHKLEQ